MLIAYIIIRADAWSLLLFSKNTSGRIVKVDKIIYDPHTTTLKAKVGYTFSNEEGKVYSGSGDRVFMEGENTSNLTWLLNTGIEIVYLINDPEINGISGCEYAVLFPLILIPFVIAMELFIPSHSRS